MSDTPAAVPQPDWLELIRTFRDITSPESAAGSRSKYRDMDPQERLAWIHRVACSAITLAEGKQS